jgi:hypothetical protein
MLVLPMYVPSIKRYSAGSICGAVKLSTRCHFVLDCRIDTRFIRRELIQTRITWSGGHSSLKRIQSQGRGVIHRTLPS